jgi:hypothetical protein
MRHQTAMDLCWRRPGNTHDIHILEPLVKQVIEKVGKPRAVAADAKEKHGMRWVNILSASNPIKIKKVSECDHFETFLTTN